jgi:hypothetical protein
VSDAGDAMLWTCIIRQQIHEDDDSGMENMK